MSLIKRLPWRRLCCTLVRQRFSEECEEGLNKQIGMELKAHIEYLSMAFHFDRCDVAMPGMHKFFMDASKEEREHAIMIAQYINKRGGTVKFAAVEAPQAQFKTIKDALMVALELEKAVNESLLQLHELAQEHNDANMCDFIKANYLNEQVEAQKQLADFIAQAERCGDGLGNYIFDKYFLKGAESVHGSKSK